MLNFITNTYKEFKDLLKPTIIALFFLVVINILINYLLFHNLERSIVNQFISFINGIDSNKIDSVVSLVLQSLLVAVVFSYGYIIKIFTQSFVDDKIKGDYLDNGIDDKPFEKLRDKVIEKLKITQENFIELLEMPEKNDYILYIILGNKNEFEKIKPSGVYHNQVEIISFIYGALIFSMIGNLLWLFAVNSDFIIISALIISLAFLVWVRDFTVKLATKRYIARNTRLYINYLLLKESN